MSKIFFQSTFHRTSVERISNSKQNSNKLEDLLRVLGMMFTQDAAHYDIHLPFPCDFFLMARAPVGKRPGECMILPKTYRLR